MLLILEFTIISLDFELIMESFGSGTAVTALARVNIDSSDSETRIETSVSTNRTLRVIAPESE
jgi:hypothetical protein